ncbi:hypothetical protein SLEP1_g32366 [Rubroshorea leprosula]|uniref:TF-B3 domain-containing protein n=1 Tax=Rubroshorea leprosula TaxID=152421 RepID=A0AAV5KDA7_9ROSI|nr:hypothetical protein SLEP1_g32366 [Rubroshorea leprosula]
MSYGRVACNRQDKPLCHKRKRATYDDDLGKDGVKSAVMERAREVQANLSTEFPSFIKHLLQSHVTKGFWLGICRRFSQIYLPKQDTVMILEDENGKEFETKYLAGKAGLSAGWRWFSIAHKLLEGDVVVFHLVERLKFKVYIVRCNGYDEVDGALGLLKLEACNKPAALEKEVEIHEEMADMSLEEMMLAPDISEENNKNVSLMSNGTNMAPVSHHSENDSENLVSEVMDGIMLSDSVVDFKDVKSIKDFTILVNGLIINSGLSKYLQTKYYELCCSQNSFLHDHLLEGLNCKLAAGVIAETINIADAIRASKLNTSEDNFLTWDKTLKAFEVLGMNVGFLQVRLHQLTKLSLQSKRCREAKYEWDIAEEEKRMLESKLFEVNEKLNVLDTEIKTLEVNPDSLEIMFEEAAKAPW